MGKGHKPKVKVHCKRELMHAVWNHLMDEEFVKGCTEGLKIRCANGIDRTSFLHLLTYSADYPKKGVISIPYHVAILMVDTESF